MSSGKEDVKSKEPFTEWHDNQIGCSPHNTQDVLFQCQSQPHPESPLNKEDASPVSWLLLVPTSIILQLLKAKALSNLHGDFANAEEMDSIPYTECAPSDTRPKHKC